MNRLYKTIICTTFLVQLACSQSTLLDLTISLQNSTLFFPGHHDFISTISLRGQMGDLEWVANEHFISGTHLGTHMDAPLHFNPNGWTIDEIPIERFIVPAVFIDIRYKSLVDPDVNVSMADITAFEQQYGRIPDGSVIFQCAGWSDFLDNETLLFGNDIQNVSDFHFPAFDRDAVEWLVVNRFIVGIGVDSPSLDWGQSTTMSTHIYAASQSLYGLEFVKDTCLPPPIGTTAYIFPSKLKGLSGASTRVIIEVPAVDRRNRAPVMLSLPASVMMTVISGAMFIVNP